jgi:hypothetical protein
VVPRHLPLSLVGPQGLRARHGERVVEDARRAVLDVDLLAAHPVGGQYVGGVARDYRVGFGVVDDLALAHHDEAIAHPDRVVHVVRDHDRREARLGDDPLGDAEHELRGGRALVAQDGELVLDGRVADRRQLPFRRSHACRSCSRPYPWVSLSRMRLTAERRMLGPS